MSLRRHRRRRDSYGGGGDADDVGEKEHSWRSSISSSFDRLPTSLGIRRVRPPVSGPGRRGVDESVHIAADEISALRNQVESLQMQLDAMKESHQTEMRRLKRAHRKEIKALLTTQRRDKPTARRGNRPNGGGPRRRTSKGDRTSGGLGGALHATSLPELSSRKKIQVPRMIFSTPLTTSANTVNIPMKGTTYRPTEETVSVVEMIGYSSHHPRLQKHTSPRRTSDVCVDPWSTTDGDSTSITPEGSPPD